MMLGRMIPTAQQARAGENTYRQYCKSFLQTCAEEALPALEVCTVK